MTYNEKTPNYQYHDPNERSESDIHTRQNIRDDAHKVGYCRECQFCGCRYADFDSPIPPMHISEVPYIPMRSISREIEFKMIRERFKYGVCSDCESERPINP